MPHLSGSFRFEHVDPPPVEPLLCADTHKISHKHKAGNLSPHPVSSITRFSIFLAAIALTILALLAACGSNAPSDPAGIESTDRSTSAPAADQERSTAAATSASQATSVSSGRATPTLGPTSQVSTRGESSTAIAAAGRQPTPAATPPPFRTTVAPVQAPATPGPAATVSRPLSTIAPDPRPAATPTQPAKPTSVETDREALIALFDATDGRFWGVGRNTGWASDEPLNRWNGVETDADGRVVKLDLEDFGLAGRIPPELGNLSHLIVLDLVGNQFSGGIPPELGNLANLQTLDLRRCGLTGNIPPELGNMRSLETLYLSQNQLTGV